MTKKFAEIQPGEKFGKWTVLSKGDGKYMYNCQCSCGTIRAVNAHALRSGRSLSCGCNHWESTNAIIGNKYGELTVLERSDKYYTHKNGAKIYLLKCRCSCGKITHVTKNSLIHHRVISCGHVRNQIRHEKTNERMIGRRLGMLTVVGRAPNTIAPSGQYIHWWICKCDCGNTTKVTEQNLKHTKSCGCLRRLWTPEDDQALLTSELSNKELASKLNRTIKAIEQRKNALTKRNKHSSP